jgi:hypothetical protein
MSIIGIFGTHVLHYNHELIKKRIVKIVVKLLQQNNIDFNEPVQLVAGMIYTGITKLVVDIVLNNELAPYGIPNVSLVLFGCKRHQTEVFYVGNQIPLDAYPNIKQFVFGKTYGDEFPYILNYINMMVRIGGNKYIEQLGHDFIHKISDLKRTYFVDMNDIDILDKKGFFSSIG